MSDNLMDVKVEFPPGESADFESLLRDISNLTGRSLPSIVEQATVYFLQSAARGTKQSKTKRKIFTNPDRDAKGKRIAGERYRFRRYMQGADPIWVKTDVRMDPRRVIERRRLARNTWKALIYKSSRKSPAMTGNVKNTSNIAREAVSATVFKAATDAHITVTNRLGYMHAIAPNILSESLRKAQSRLEKYLLRKLQRDMEKKWAS